MKMDKQALAKHHFWILLGVFALFAFLLVILVPILVGAEIAEKEAKLDQAKKDLQANSSPTTDAHTKAQGVQVDTLNERRESLWQEMFKPQRDIVVFPGDMQEQLKSLKFGDDIESNFRDLFRQQSVYRAAYEQMAKIIAPTEYQPNWEGVLMPVAWKNTPLPTSEEIWLSLEDLCVRREVLKIIRDANELSAKFVEVTKLGPDEAPLPESKLGKGFAKRFRSRWYEIDLIVNDAGKGNYTFGGKITNISGRRQKIYELWLDAWLTEDLSVTEPAQPTWLKFGIADLAAGQTLKLDEFKAQLNRAPTALHKLALRHNPQTVPVKYLLEIAFGPNAAGNRMADRKLHMPRFSKKEGGEGAGSGAAAAAGNPTGKASMMMAGATNPMGANMGATMGMGGNTSQIDVTSGNGIAKSRYIDVTEQVRRIPMAVVLIADQASMQDVLTSFTNYERMRFQITHYHWKRVYVSATTSGSGGNLGGAAGGEPGDEGGGFKPMGGGAFVPGGPGGGPVGAIGPMAGGGVGEGVPKGGLGTGPMGGGAFDGPGFPGAGRSHIPSFADQPPMNLVEMTVYGIANLYERPKESTKPVTTPTPMATPMTPTKPPEATKPATGPKPGDKPVEGAKPGDKPGEGKKPDDKPAEAAKPGDKPADKPGDPAKPDATRPKDPAPAKPPTGGGADKPKTDGSKPPDAPKSPAGSEKDKPGI